MIMKTLHRNRETNSHECLNYSKFKLCLICENGLNNPGMIFK